MTWAIVTVAVLVVVASVLAMAEASISRMSRVRAITLREEGRRNAALLERIEEDPARYLNAVYLSVMFCQNGSAILVAILMERLFSDLYVTIASVVFTLLYFVVVEAMSKTYAVLHTDRVALFVTPTVWFVSRLFSVPTRLLIGVANVLLPGRGLKKGPFVSEEDIRSMANVGHEEGSIEDREREMIHSIFELGDTVVRDIMVPRPDMIVVEANKLLRRAMDMAIKHGFSRIPVYEKDPDNIVGIVYAKDLFRASMRNGRADKVEETVAKVMRPPFFVPDAKKVDDLLREMRAKRIHMAIVSDEFGDVAGLVTLEDILEEIVGEIADEYDVEEPEFVPIDERTCRVKGRMPIGELNELMELQPPLPDDEWDTVGGLIQGVSGRLPTEGEEISFQGLQFRAERVLGRRLDTVVIRRVSQRAEEDGHAG